MWAARQADPGGTWSHSRALIYREEGCGRDMSQRGKEGRHIEEKPEEEMVTETRAQGLTEAGALDFWQSIERRTYKWADQVGVKQTEATEVSRR